MVAVLAPAPVLTACTSSCISIVNTAAKIAKSLLDALRSHSLSFEMNSCKLALACKGSLLQDVRFRSLRVCMVYIRFDEPRGR